MADLPPPPPPPLPPSPPPSPPPLPPSPPQLPQQPPYIPHFLDHQEEERDDNPVLVLNTTPSPDETNVQVRSLVASKIKINEFDSREKEDGEIATKNIMDESVELKDIEEFEKKIQIEMDMYSDMADEHEKILKKLNSFPIVTVTNFSEYKVLSESLDLAHDTKIWVSDITSPNSVHQIKEHRNVSRDNHKILFASDLTADEISADRHELFDTKNPDYSSESSELDQSGSSCGYSDEDLRALCDEVNKSTK